MPLFPNHLNSPLITLIYLYSDQVLSGVGILENFAAVLSPLVLGTIYSATSETAPSTAWFVAAGLFVLASVVLLCMPFRTFDLSHRQKGRKKPKKP